VQNKLSVIIGTIGSDTHVIGARILQYAIEKAGYEAICLGAFVTQEEFVRAAMETDAVAVFVSSVYGLAELDCQGLRSKFVEAGLERILLYLGGNIATAYSGEEWPQVQAKFKAMGFDRVYPPGTLPSAAIRDLADDLSLPLEE
jgi:methylaspartate mutase sigma subunit